MTRNEMVEKIKDYRTKGMMKTVVHRTCRTPDLEGARTIIQTNPSICSLNIVQNPARELFETLNEEHFESCDDSEFSKIARAALCEGFGIFAGELCTRTED
jgi:hypothetical protein